MSTAAASSDLAPLIERLVRRRGVEILGDRARLQGLLRDYAPEAVAEIRLLLTAFDAGVVARLRSAERPLGPEVLDREAQAIAHGCDGRGDLAHRAVATWAHALDALAAVGSGPVGVATAGPALKPLPLPSVRSLPGPAPARRSCGRIALVVAAAGAMAALALRAIGAI